MRLPIMLLCAAGVVGGQATAQEFGPFAEVKAVGMRVVDDGVANQGLSSWRDRVLSVDDLTALADSFVEPCDRAALALCRADIPRPAPGAATLQVRVSEGYVSEIETDDALRAVVEAVLAPVLRERPLRRETLDRAVANLDEVRGLTIESVRPERLSGDAYRLIVTGRYESVALRGLITNRGSRRADPWRAITVLESGSLLGAGDHLSVAYLTRPQSVDELSYGVLRYATAPAASGQTAFAEVNVARNSPRTVLQGRDAQGSLRRVIFGLSSPLRRRAGSRLDLDLSFEATRSEEEEDGERLFLDELHVLRAKAVGSLRHGDRARLSSEVVVSHGLDGLGAEGGSRPDGEPGFTTLAAEVVGRARIGRRVRIEAAGTAQVSDAPLLFQEEFSLGGGEYGRAYDYGEVRGDSGIASYVEAAVVRPLRGGDVVLTPYLYADVGSTWNEGAGLKADGAVLWSAGGGVELALWRNVSLSYEAAMPLSDAPYTTDDEDLRHRLDIGWSLKL